MADEEALARGETLGEDELDARGVADDEVLARGETLGEALSDVDCCTLMVTFATDESALPAPALVACTTSTADARLSRPPDDATVMAPVVALMAKVPFAFPLRIAKVRGKPRGSDALTTPTTAPAAALSGTLKADA